MRTARWSRRVSFASFLAARLTAAFVSKGEMVPFAAGWPVEATTHSVQRSSHCGLVDVFFGCSHMSAWCDAATTDPEVCL